MLGASKRSMSASPDHLVALLVTQNRLYLDIEPSVQKAKACVTILVAIVLLTLNYRLVVVILRLAKPHVISAGLASASGLSRNPDETPTQLHITSFPLKSLLVKCCAGALCRPC